MQTPSCARRMQNRQCPTQLAWTWAIRAVCRPRRRMILRRRSLRFLDLLISLRR
jgi:hypothetical protein